MGGLQGAGHRSSFSQLGDLRGGLGGVATPTPADADVLFESIALLH